MGFLSETPVDQLIERASAGDWSAAKELAYMNGDPVNLTPGMWVVLQRAYC